MKRGLDSSVCGQLAGGEVIMWLRFVDPDHLALFSKEVRQLCDLNPSLDAPDLVPWTTLTFELVEYTCSMFSSLHIPRDLWISHAL